MSLGPRRLEFKPPMAGSPTAVSGLHLEHSPTESQLNCLQHPVVRWLQFTVLFCWKPMFTSISSRKYPLRTLDLLNYGNVCLTTVIFAVQLWHLPNDHCKKGNKIRNSHMMTSLITSMTYDNNFGLNYVVSWGLPAFYQF